MISRRSAKHIAEGYANTFTKLKAGAGGYTETVVANEMLYDFLFEHDYPAWLCNATKFLRRLRQLKEFVMQLHTGESQTQATPKWDWDQRRRLGQQYLKDLAQDCLNDFTWEARYRQNDPKKERAEILRSLELDGYVYQDEQLLAPEADVLDAKEEAHLLERLYSDSKLADKATALHHLALSEEHYLSGRWEDSISNSRKFFEAVLREVAAAHSTAVKSTSLSPRTHERPAAVREYLQREGLLEPKEMEAIAKVYGLLSNTGGHPYMAEKDQARLLRHLALTLSQFVMLRLQGALAGGAAA